MASSHLYKEACKVPRTVKVCQFSLFSALMVVLCACANTRRRLGTSNMCSECTPWRNCPLTPLWQCTPPLHAVTISLLLIDSHLCVTVVSTLVSVTPLFLPLSRPLQPKAVKNVSYDAFGTKLGRVHMQRQDFQKLQTRKRKALKKPTGNEAKRSKSVNQGT